jgi:excisionase family DNA binding protein
MKKDKFLTVKQVAQRLNVCERSVIRYIKSKKLVASKMGQWRIKEKDFEAFYNLNKNK